MMMIDVIPQESFDGVPVPSAVTLDGELLGALDDAPAGPWGARNAQRRHARLASLGSLMLLTPIHSLHAGNQPPAPPEAPPRRDLDVAADAEVSLALREPLRCAQNRIHRALRLRTLLPAFKRAFHRGDLSDYDVIQLVEATSCTDDAKVLARCEEATLANLRGQSGSELRRYARRLVDRSTRPPRCTARVRSGPRRAGASLPTQRSHLPRWNRGRS